MINVVRNLKLYGLLKGYFLVLLLMVLILLQLLFTTFVAQIEVVTISFDKLVVNILNDSATFGLIFIGSFMLCCAVWFLYRPFHIVWLIIKNKSYLPGFLYGWLVTRAAAQPEQTAKTANEYYWIFRNAAKVAKKLKVTAPDIAVDQTLDINAKVLPEFFHPTLIVLTQGLLNKLTPDEIEAVIAHELAHVKMRDTLSMSIIYLLMMLIIWLPVYVLHFFIDYVILYKWRDKKLGFMLSLLLVVMTYGLLPLLVFNTINRRFELRADKLAVQFSNSQSFFSALNTVHASQSQLADPLEAGLALMPKTVQAIVLRMLLSHPSIPSRIAALQ